MMQGLSRGRSARIALLLLFVRMTAFGLTEDKGVLDVPFRELSNGFILIDASVDGVGTRPFLLDTGSSVSLLIDSNTANKDRLKLVRPRTIQIENQSSQKSRPDKWYRVTVRSGAAILAKGDVPAVDLSSVKEFLAEPLAGIIGLPLTSSYVVEIDYGAHMIHLYEFNRYSPRKEGLVLPLIPSKAKLLIVDTRIFFGRCDSEKVRAYVDSGADQSIVLGKEFAALHSSVLGDDPPSRGTGLGELSGRSVTINGIEIGNWFIPSRGAFALQASSTRALDNEASIALGAPILRQFTIVINRLEGTLQFIPRSGRPTADHDVSSCEQDGLTK